MITSIIFAINTIEAIKTVNKQYKWYENLEITIRSYKAYFILTIICVLGIFFVSNMYYITTLINLQQPMNYFGTLGNGYSYIMTKTTIMLGIATIYYTFKQISTKDKTIKKIEEKYKK